MDDNMSKKNNNNMSLLTEKYIGSTFNKTSLTNFYDLSKYKD